MIKKIIILFAIHPVLLLSQIDNSSYNVLNLNSSSRILSMGGSIIAILDNDVSLSFSTPSLLNEGMNNQISFNFLDYVSDVDLISFHSAKKISKKIMIFAGINAINYGEFYGTDAIGNATQNFTASQQIIVLGSSKKLSDKFTFGVNIHLLNSNLERYHSLTLSSNISSTYFNKISNFTSTLLIKNVGRPLIYYTSQKEDLPFEIQFGISKSLKYLPFRYSVVFHSLNKYDISNDFNLNTIYDPITNEIIVKDETHAKKVLRHIILGGELNPFRKNLYFRGGFNFQRREDLKLSSSFTMSGFAWGLGFSIKNIQINYARSAIHSSSMVNSFSIVTNLSKFVKRNE